MIYVITANINNGYQKIKGRFSTMEAATKYAATLDRKKQHVFIAKVNTSNNNQN